MNWRVAGLFLAVAIGHASAQGRWLQRSFPVEPPRSLYWDSLAYDSARGVVVALGRDALHTETWEYDGLAWVPITPAASLWKIQRRCCKSQHC